MERNDQLKLKVMLEKIATLLPGGNGEKCHKLLEAAETFLSGVQKQEEADKKTITKLKEAGLDELLKTGIFFLFFFSLSDSWQDSKVASAKRTARPPKKADDFFQDDGDDDDDDEPKKTPSKKSVSVKKAKKLQAVAIEADPAPTEWSCDKVPIFPPFLFLAL